MFYTDELFLHIQLPLLWLRLKCLITFIYLERVSLYKILFTRQKDSNGMLLTRLKDSKFSCNSIP